MIRTINLKLDVSDDEHFGVSIANVGQFVRYHAFQFLIVKIVDDARCQGHGIGFLVDA